MDRRDDLFDDRRRLELDAATTRFLTGVRFSELEHEVETLGREAGGNENENRQ